MEYTIKELMQPGIDLATTTMEANIGGPFGAVILDENGEILSIASNTVLRDNDPTCHAEMNAIRTAAKIKGTYDLTGCTLLTTAECCPMCLSATIWANIKDVHYGCTAKDAAEIGFRDDYIYDFIKGGCKDESVMKLTNENRDECIKLFQSYAKNHKVIY